MKRNLKFLAVGFMVTFSVLQVRDWKQNGSMVHTASLDCEGSTPDRGAIENSNNSGLAWGYKLTAPQTTSTLLTHSMTTHMAVNTNDNTWVVTDKVDPGLSATQDLGTSAWKKPSNRRSHAKLSAGYSPRVNGMNGKELKVMSVNTDNVTVASGKNTRKAHIVRFTKNNIFNVYKVLKK